MIKSSIFFIAVIFSTPTLSENVFSEEFSTKKFDVTDIKIINEFCISYKADLLKDFGLITSANVSKETYIEFGLLASKLRPGSLDFFKSLKEMGAEDCAF